MQRPDDLVALEALLKGINSEATILCTQHSRVDVRSILDRGMYSNVTWMEKWSENQKMESSAGNGSEAGRPADSKIITDGHNHHGFHSLHEDGTVSDIRNGTAKLEDDEIGHSNTEHSRHSHIDTAAVKTLTLRTDCRLDLER